MTCGNCRAAAPCSRWTTPPCGAGSGPPAPRRTARTPPTPESSGQPADLDKDSSEKDSRLYSDKWLNTETRSVCRALTFTSVCVHMAQDVLPLLQDLLQRRLQFTGQDAVLVPQLSHRTGGVKDTHMTSSTNTLRLLLFFYYYYYSALD